MAKVTIVLGVLLALLGVGFYVLVVPHAITALIPLFFGFVLIVCGLLADTRDTRRRMLFMHIAVTVGLVGFVLPFVRGIGRVLEMLQGIPVVRPLAVEEQMLMALICLIFVGLCVRNFIAARRARI